MHDTKESSLLSVKKELSEVTYQLIRLYDRWVVEHQMVAKREAEMSRATELFTEQMKKLDADIQKHIQTTASQAIVMVGDTVGKETKKHFEREVGPAAKRLEDMVHRFDHFIPEYEKVKESDAIKTILIVGLVSFVVGCFVGSWWIARNTITVDELRTVLKCT